MDQIGGFGAALDLGLTGIAGVGDGLPKQLEEEKKKRKAGQSALNTGLPGSAAASSLLTPDLNSLFGAFR